MSDTVEDVDDEEEEDGGRYDVGDDFEVVEFGRRLLVVVDGEGEEVGVDGLVGVQGTDVGDLEGEGQRAEGGEGVGEGEGTGGDGGGGRGRGGEE